MLHSGLVIALATLALGSLTAADLPSIEGLVTRITLGPQHELCLCPEVNSNGSPVVLLDCSDARTRVVPTAGTYRFLNANRCLDAAGGRPVIWDCGGPRNQTWEVVDGGRTGVSGGEVDGEAGAGGWTYSPKAEQSLCLSVSEAVERTEARLSKCERDDEGQRWDHWNV